MAAGGCTAEADAEESTTPQHKASKKQFLSPRGAAMLWCTTSDDAIPLCTSAPYVLHGGRRVGPAGQRQEAQQSWKALGGFLLLVSTGLSLRLFVTHKAGNEIR